MTAVAPALTDTIGALSAAFAVGDEMGWAVGLNELLEMTIDLLSEGDVTGIGVAYEEIEILSASSQAAEETVEGAHGQLRLMSMLMSLASVRPGREELHQLATNERNVLLAMADAPEALDNRELMAQTGHAEAVVSRALRKLRAAGLVTTHKEWRRKLSVLTDKGRRIASELPRPAAPRKDLSLLMTKLLRADAGPADVWAMVNRAGIDVIQTSSGSHEMASAKVDGGQWRIEIDAAQSERQTRHLMALGLGRLAALSDFPPAEDKQSLNEWDGSHSITSAETAGMCSREDFYAGVCCEAFLLPELPTTRMFLELRDTYAMAERFNVSETLVRTRLSRLGLYSMEGDATGIGLQPDVQPEDFPLQAVA